MSQIEINNNVNSVNVQSTFSTVDVNQDSNIIIVPQEITNVVEVVTPGPQGAKGEPGDPSLFTSSFVTTASFFAFTSSYYANSASFSASISQLQDFSSSLDATFATDAELNYSSSVLSASIGALSGSYLNSSASFNTRILANSSSIGILSSSFLNASASFDTRILANSSSIGILSSSYLASSASFNTRINDINGVTGSYATTGSNIFSGSQVIIGNLTLTGSILFDGGSSGSGASIVPNAGLANSLDLIAGTNGWVELASNDGQQYVWVDNNGVYLITNWNVDNKQWTFDKSGSLTTPGNIIVNGLVSASNGFTGSLFGTASHVDTLVSASFQTSTDNITLFYGNNTSASFTINNTNSASYAATASYADNFTVAGTLTAQTINVQTITSSVIYSSGSNVFGNDLSNTQVFTGSVKITGSLAVNGIDYISTSASIDNRILANSSSIGILSSSFLAFSSSYNTGSFTGSFNGTVTGSFSGSLWNLQNLIVGHVPYFSSSQVLTDSSIIQIDNGYSVAINQNGVTTAAPEALYVWQPSTSSFNVISGKGNLDNYLQLNIQNVNQGISASSDVVATANNGTELTNYIDMGINGENYIDNGNGVGTANDAYLYSTGNRLNIGNASNNVVSIFAGGFNVNTNRKLLINPNNYHELTGSLNISNSLIVNNGITGSLFGTASYAVSASQATNTNNALTASYILPLNQKVEITGSLEITGSSTFNGPVGVIDSNVYLLDSSSLYLNSGSSIFVETPGVISGSIVGIGNVTTFSSSVNYRLTALETLIDGGFY